MKDVIFNSDVTFDKKMVDIKEPHGCKKCETTPHMPSECIVVFICVCHRKKKIYKSLMVTTDQDMQDAFDWLDDKVHANEIAKKTWTNKSKAGGRVLYKFAVVLKKAYKEGKIMRVK